MPGLNSNKIVQPCGETFGQYTNKVTLVIFSITQCKLKRSVPLSLAHVVPFFFHSLSHTIILPSLVEKTQLSLALLGCTSLSRLGKRLPRPLPNRPPSSRASSRPSHPLRVQPWTYLASCCQRQATSKDGVKPTDWQRITPPRVSFNLSQSSSSCSALTCFARRCCLSAF